MATTRVIKRRIRGITSTKQITNAMELVSTAKLRKARLKLEQSRPYYSTVSNDVVDLLQMVKTGYKYLKKREVKCELHIVITGDRGLAGGYNSNILKLAEDKIKASDVDVKIITVGTKARDFFIRKKYNVIKSITGISESFKYKDASYLGEYMLSLYNNGDIDRIYLYYTDFISMISCKPKRILLFPFERIEGSSELEKRDLIMFEPSPEEVLEYLIPKYLEIVIYGAFIESAASEQSSRRVAMENATDNANNMIEELSIEYNRARQAAITSEISEIVSGAEALR